MGRDGSCSHRLLGNLVEKQCFQGVFTQVLSSVIHALAVFGLQMYLHTFGPHLSICPHLLVLAIPLRWRIGNKVYGDGSSCLWSQPSKGWGGFTGSSRPAWATVLDSNKFLYAKNKCLCHVFYMSSSQDSGNVLTKGGVIVRNSD